MAALRAWFVSLARREQRFVLAGAAACLVLLLMATWLPFEHRLTQLQQRVQTKQADLVWLQSVAPQLQALRSAAPAAGGESLVALADSVARSSGIARALSSQPGGDGTLSVRLEQVAFDALLSWAGELVQHHGVRVVSASIDGGANPGLVSATIVLRGP
jgi:type II secretory pathway component PulM